MKKQITILMLLAFFGLSVNSAFAQFDGGTGTSADPYKISTVIHLVDLATDVNGGNAYAGKYFILTADLDLTSYSSGTGWKPIGIETAPFSGKFNGNGKKISNLFINDATLNYMGLFGHISEALIENLGVENVNVTAGGFSVGGVVGGAHVGSSISDCYSTGSVKGDSGVGGVVGSIGGGDASVTNCYSTGNVSGTESVGGVVGSITMAKSITNCYSTGNVSGTDKVGGVVGRVYYSCSATNCYSTGKVSGETNVGGVAGSVEFYCSIKTCYSKGEISGTGVGVGGVAGRVEHDSSISDSYSEGNISGYLTLGGVSGILNDKCSITNCYSTGNVSGEKGVVGGVAGESIADYSITNCYSTGNVSGKVCVGGVAATLLGNGSITNCYSTGNVSGDEYVGGVVGSAAQSSVTNCYSTGDVSGAYSVGGVAGTIINNSSIEKCYSTGAVTGFKGVGGIAGQLENNSKIKNCAALNPSVKGDTDAGRIAGILNGGANILANNIAFDGIIDKDGNTTWSNIGLTNLDGDDTSKETINSDSTLGNRFTSPVWTTEKGSLPGLNGNTVAMPAHLKMVGIASATLSNRITVYPNPTTGELRIENGELRIENVEIYDIMGRKQKAESRKGEEEKGEVMMDISHFPAGVYFLRIDGQTVKVIKN